MRFFFVYEFSVNVDFILFCCTFYFQKCRQPREDETALRGDDEEEAENQGHATGGIPPIHHALISITKTKLTKFLLIYQFRGFIFWDDVNSETLNSET